MKRSNRVRGLALVAALVGVQAAWAADPPPAVFGWSAEAAAGAAGGYCMAKHPYLVLDSQRVGLFTRDGYETVSPPGVVIALRRNFVYDRSTDEKDEGQNQSCAQACAQLGKAYPGLVGRALRQRVGDGTQTIASGLGDLGAMALLDAELSPGSGQVVAGIGSRGNTWQQSDVAMADYCCCQVMTPR